MAMRLSHTLPRVALVRGIGLDVQEMQTFEPLQQYFDLRAFGLFQHRTDMTGTRIPCEWLKWKDSICGRSLLNCYHARLKSERYYMPGLEKRLAGCALAHSTEIHSTCSWQVVRARKDLGCRVVITCAENIPFPGWTQRSVVERKAHVIQETDAFFALTPEAAHVLHEEGVSASRIRIVPYGLDLERFKPGDPDPSWLRCFGIQPGDFVILFLGRLVWEKGIFELLSAAQIMDPQNLRILIVGDGPERQALERYRNLLKLESIVTFSPFVPYQQVEQIHRMADVLVLPSIPTRGVREQFGLVLIEAMACGKPTVATRCGSMPGVIRDAGVLADPANAESLAQTLNRLRSDPELRRHLGERGRLLAEQIYDRNLVAATIRETFQRLIG